MVKTIMNCSPLISRHVPSAHVCALSVSLIAMMACSGVIYGQAPERRSPDWAYWVGPQFTGISPEKGIPDQWNPQGGEGSHVLWEIEGGSRSTPIIMNGRLYVMTRSFPEEMKRTGEKIVCRDADNGEVLWEYAFNVSPSDVPVEQVGWSNVVGDPETGNVYAQGASGYFCCLNGKTGELIWDRSLSEEFGFLATQGGRTNGPVIHEGDVIINGMVIGWGDQASLSDRILAMDKTNGLVIWYEGTGPLPENRTPRQTTGSAPVIGVVDGELQMICSGGNGTVCGFQPRTGKKLWACHLSSTGTTGTPLLMGDRVFVGYSDGNQDSALTGGIACIDATQRGDISGTGITWKKTDCSVGQSSPLLIDSRLYFVDDSAHLHCVNPDTGEEIGKPVPLGTKMQANLLSVDGKLFANDVSGQGFILKPTESGAEIIHRYQFPEGDECYGSPIAWQGRVYIPTTGHLYCVGAADHDETPDELPALPREMHVALDEIPASLELVPAELLLSPGTGQRFHARLYNSKGQYLHNARPEELDFTVQGPGAIDDAARYGIPSTQMKPEGVIVTARWRDVPGTARLRVIPELNWTFDFNDGKVPETWIGANDHYVPLDWDLLSSLRADNSFTGDLYLYVMTEFNRAGPVRAIDDSSSRQSWSRMLSFFNLSDGTERPGTLEECQAKFDASLQKLVDEKVLQEFVWSTWDRSTGSGDETVPEPRLSFHQGERKIKGNGVLCQVRTNPNETRSPSWLGPVRLNNYTVQADVLSLARGDKLPDGGIIGQRYALDLTGASQQIQLRTWTSQPDRFSASVPFEWKPDVWYTMKIKTTINNGKGLVQGKIWPRDSEEPGEWTVTGEDLAPNLIGSPGLSAKTRDGDFFYDNLTVTKNAED